MPSDRRFRLPAFTVDVDAPAAAPARGAYSGSSGATGGVPGGATPPRAPTSTEP